MVGSSRRIVIEFLGKDTSLGRTASDVGGKTSTLGSKLSKVGKIAAVGLGAGLAIGAKALWDAGKAAAADAESQAVLANTLENTTGANKKQVAQVESWIAAQGRALGVTDDELRPALGRLATATGDVGKAQKLASLAMDVSAGTGKSLKTVSEALARAQNGNVSGLFRLGIATKDAAGNTKSLSQITKELGDNFGGAASTKANTFQGKMDRLKLAMSETKEAIGAKLLPIADKLGGWLLDVGLPAASKFGGYLSDKLGPAFSKIGDVVASVTGGMNGDVTANLGRVRETFASVVSIIRSLWRRFGGFIVEYAGSFFKNLRTVVGGALKVISGVFKLFSSLLKGDWKGAWDAIKRILSGAWDIIKGVVKQALNTLKLLFKVAWSAIKGIVAGVWDGIKALVRNGAGWIVDQIKAIPGRLRALGGVFADAGRAIIGKFVDGLKNAAGVVSGIAGNVWGAVKSLLNSAIDKINAALEFTINLPGPDVHINPPNIPHLAKGGIVTRPTLALIGEAGPEAVVPLTGPHAPPRAGLAGGSVVNINIRTLDSMDAARQVERLLLRLQRQTGRPLQFRTV